MAQRICDLIEVPPVQTVIRIDDGRTQARSIAASFVFTAEVADHLAVLAHALQKPAGQGYFLHGDFGSGKSHFLAAIAAWLAGEPGSDILTSAHPGLDELRRTGRRLLPVAISLVNYRSATPLETILMTSFEEALARNHVHAGLSPFSGVLRQVRDTLRDQTAADAFAQECGIPVSALDAWFAGQPRQAYAVSTAFLKKRGMPMPDLLSEERHELFHRALRIALEAGFSGVVILIDELSEFFRSKEDASLLNEDARTLQLLGEMSGRQPLWVIAALQESVERTGDIAQATFRKIKDRFPIKLQLSTLHIRDLISKRLVRHKPGAGAEIHRIYQEYRRHFPQFSCDFEHFRSIYPLHPATLSLLEGLGELFSQHRGIVDFVHAQVAGDPDRGIGGVLEKPSTELVAPDAIYDHFAPRLSEFSAYHVYPRHVIPHLDSVIDEVIQEPGDRPLCKRLVRMLVLYGIHPAAHEPSARLLAELGSCMIASHDPDANAQFVAGALLDKVVDKSRFLSKRQAASGDPLDAVYAVTTREDHAKTFRARIERCMGELSDSDSRIVADPLGELPQSMGWPGVEIWAGSAERTVLWRQTSRRAVVAFIHKGNERNLAARIQAMLAEGKADFSLAVAFEGVAFAAEHTAVWQLPLQGHDMTVFKEYFATRMVAAELRPASPADAPLLPMAKEALRRLEPAVRQELLGMIYSGHFDKAGLHVDPAALQLRRFDRLLETAAEFLLDQRYPKFKDIAPRGAGMSSRMYQRLLDEFVVPGTLSMREARGRGLTEAIETLAAPLGLVDVKSGSYVLAPNLGEHPYLAYVFGLLRPAEATPLDEMLSGLRTGPYGVPLEMAEFTLVALAHCGLVSLLNRGRTKPLEHLLVTAVGSADAIAPGEIISQADRDTLLQHCTFLAPPGGWGAFGLRQQREAWQAVVKLKRTGEQHIEEISRSLSRSAGYMAFESLDIPALDAKLKAFRAALDVIKVSYLAREGLEAFIAAWRASGLSGDDLGFIAKMHKFLARFSEQFIAVTHYLRHRSAEQAALLDERVGQYRNAVLMMLREPETLVVADEGVQLTAAFDLFRQSYGECYASQHAAYYAALAKPALSKYAERILAVIRRLAAVAPLDRPAGLQMVLQQLDTPARPECRRALAEQLLRSPVCACGFQVGAKPETAGVDNPAQALEELLCGYTAILRNPAVGEAIIARAYALRDINAAAAKRLDDLAASLKSGGTISPSTLLDLLDEQTVAEIERALSGSIEVSARDLNSLIANLAGRRLTPQKIAALVQQWVGAAGAGTILSIEGGDARRPADFGQQSVAWWPLLRPDLFSPKQVLLSSEHVRTMEQALGEAFPPDNILPRLMRLESERLARFIAEEPCHTHAVRAAWGLLAQRILAQPADAAPLQPASRHLIAEEATGIAARLEQLKSVGELLGLGFPSRLRARVPLSAIAADPWATRQLHNAIDAAIDDLGKASADWVATLQPAPVIGLHDSPAVLIVDALAPDVWLEAAQTMSPVLNAAVQSWSRLTAAPFTIAAMNALFGFAADRDPINEFAVRGVTYHQIQGDDAHSLVKLLPGIQAGIPVVIRLGLLDSVIHDAAIRLCDLPQLLRAALARNLPDLLQLCAQQRRRLILTTDHGMSFVRRRMLHGKGGVFEEAIVRIEWGCS